MSSLFSLTVGPLPASPLPRIAPGERNPTITVPPCHLKLELCVLVLILGVRGHRSAWPERKLSASWSPGANTVLVTLILQFSDLCRGHLGGKERASTHACVHTCR